MNCEGMAERVQAMATGTEIATDLFRWWEELNQLM